MGFAEVNLLGVYVAPISVIMVVAWVITVALRRIAVHLDLLSRVWHPSAFVFGIFIIVLSSITLLIAR
jgi:protein AaeX